jgi:polyadenylate-binding protein
MVENMSVMPQQKEYPNSIYIGDLSKKCFDIQVINYFTRNGCKPLQAKVILDKISGEHKGFAYASYATQQEAQNAINKLNNTDLEGKKIRVMWKNKSDINTEANVLVKNLDLSVDQQMLQELFAAHGTIISSKVDSYKDGTSRGFGYVQFEKTEEAEKAIKEMHNKEVKGKKIDVCKHNKKQISSHHDDKFNNLYVTGLPKGTDDAKLKEMFGKFGEIISSKVQLDN